MLFPVQFCSLAYCLLLPWANDLIFLLWSNGQSIHSYNGYILNDSDFFTDNWFYNMFCTTRILDTQRSASIDTNLRLLLWAQEKEWLNIFFVCIKFIIFLYPIKKIIHFSKKKKNYQKFSFQYILYNTFGPCR